VVHPDTRQRITREDAQLAIRLVARSSESDERELQLVLANQGLDALLDDARLPPAILREPLGALASMPLFTYVVMRYALRRVGEDDRMLADYLAAVVLTFGVRDRAQRADDNDDEIYATLADLLRDAEGRDPRRTYKVRAHLGNYALWLSGLFPDYIEQRRWRRGGPALEYYEAMGTRGFELAAEHGLAKQQQMSDLYAAAAQRFATLRLALTGLSDALLFPRLNSPERLMRQVRDETRWRWVH